MGTLDKLLEEDTDEIINSSERFLRKTYQNFTESLGRANTYLKVETKSDITALDILTTYNYLSYTCCSGPKGRGVRITDKGKEFFDKNFRKEGEYFNLAEKWRMEKV